MTYEVSKTNLGMDTFRYPISLPLPGIDTFRYLILIPHSGIDTFRYFIVIWILGIDTSFDTKVLIPVSPSYTGNFVTFPLDYYISEIIKR